MHNLVLICLLLFLLFVTRQVGVLYYFTLLIVFTLELIAAITI